MPGVLCLRPHSQTPKSSSCRVWTVTLPHSDPWGGAYSVASKELDMVKATTGNPRFFSRSGPYPLAVVAEAARGIADELDLLPEGVAPLQTAGPNEVSFLDNRRYASASIRRWSVP